MPRARASSARLNFSALPPPDFGLKKRTGCPGGCALASGTWSPEGGARGDERQGESGPDHECLDQVVAIGYQDADRCRECQTRDRDSQNPGQPGPKQAVPGGGQRDHHAGEDDQAARELVDHDVDRQNEDRGRQNECGDCGYAPRHPFLH